MDEQLENKAQEVADNMEKAANESWQNVEFAANQAEENVQSAVNNAASNMAYNINQSADNAYSFGSAPVQPVSNHPITPPQPAPQTYQPAQYAPNDPRRWSGELYTPEAPTPADQQYTQAPQGGYIDAQRAGFSAPPPTPVKPKDDKFPVWAIVLIVLLVLLICIACTLLPFALIGKWVVGIFSQLIS